MSSIRHKIFKFPNMYPASPPATATVAIKVVPVAKRMSIAGPSIKRAGWKTNIKGTKKETMARRAAVTNQMPRGTWQSAEPVAQGIVASCTPAFREAHGTVIPLAAGFPTAGLGMDVL